MLRMHSGAAATAAALFVCVLAAGAAREARAAAQFSIEPLRLNLPAGKLAAPLTIGNKGTKPVTVQAELVSWSQDGGKDTYGEPTGLIVSPPIFSIAPGASQIVRVGRLKRGTPPPRELAYRIRLVEVPAKPGEGGEAVSTFMQISLPVFVPPADRGALPAVAIQGAKQDGAALRITLSNAGAVHDKITRLVLLRDGKPVAQRGDNFYVLAGATRELVWAGVVKPDTTGAVELRLDLEGRNRSLSHPLTLAPPPAPAEPQPPPAPGASEPQR